MSDHDTDLDVRDLHQRLVVALALALTERFASVAANALRDLREGSEEERLAAVAIVAGHACRPGWLWLLRMVRDPSEAVAFAALAALEAGAEPDLVLDAARRAARDRRRAVSRHGFEALRRLHAARSPLPGRGPADPEWSIERLGGSDPWASVAAAAALPEAGAVGVEALGRACSSQQPDVAEAALAALLKVAPRSGFQVAAELVERGALWAKRLAFESLRGFGAEGVQWAVAVATKPHPVAAAECAVAAGTGDRPVAIAFACDRLTELAAASWESASEAVRIALASGDDATRRAAVEIVGRHAGAEDVELLDRALVDDFQHVQVAALRAAARVDPGHVVDHCRRVAESVNDAVLPVMVELLRGVDGAAPQLLSWLDDPEERVRLAALLVLAELAEREAVAAAMARCREDRHPLVRAAVLHALAAVDPASALVGARDGVRAEEPEQRLVAALVFSRHGDDSDLAALRELAADADPAVRGQALESLLAHSEDGVELLLREVLHKHLRSGGLTAAVRALRDLACVGAPASLEVILARVGDNALVIRLAALRAVTTVAPARGPVLALAHLNDASEEVRGWAESILLPLVGYDEKIALKVLRHGAGELLAAALATVESRRAGEDFAAAVEDAIARHSGAGLHPLARALAARGPAYMPRMLEAVRGRGGDRRARVRKEVCAVLDEFGEREDGALLARLAVDPDGEVQLAALTASRQVAPEMVAELELAGARSALAQDDITTERTLWAIDCLRAAGSEDDAVLVAACFESRAVEVRRAALGALAVLAPGRPSEVALDALDDSDPFVREVALDLVGRAGREVFGDLVEKRIRMASYDSECRAALQACRIIGQPISDDLVAVLCRIALRLASPSETILNLIGDQAPEAVAVIARHMLTGDVYTTRRAGAIALARWGGYEDAAVLVKLLGDDDEEVRAAALSTLAVVAPDEAGLRAPGMLADHHPEVVRRAADLIPERPPPSLAVARAMACSADLDVVRRGWRRIAELVPDQLVDEGLGLLAGARWTTLTVVVPALHRSVSGRDATRLATALTRATGAGVTASRACAVRMLATLFEREGLQRVLELVEDREGDVREAALEEAVRMAPERETELRLLACRAALADPSWPNRRDAVNQLRDSGGIEDVARLETMIRDDDNDVREAALRALERSSPGRATEVAVDLLDDSFDNVVRAAVEVLERARDEARQLVLGRWSSLSDKARIPAVGFLRAADLTQEIAGALLGDTSEVVREAGLRLATKAFPLQVAALRIEAARRNLTHSSWRVRRAAIEEVKARAEPSDIPLFENLTSDEDNDVREAALVALADLAPERASEAALRCLGDPYPNVRQAARRAVRATDVPALRRLLSSDSAELRREAVRLLGRIGGRGELGRVLARLSDAAAEVRWSAVVAARRLDPGRELEIARRMVADPVPAVRAKAVRWLGRRGDEGELPLLRQRLDDGDEAVQVATLDAISWLTPGGPATSLSLVMQALESPHQKVVDWAVGLLTAHAGGVAREILLAAIPRSRGDGAGRLVDEVVRLDGGRADDAIAALLANPSPVVDRALAGRRVSCSEPVLGQVLARLRVSTIAEARLAHWQHIGATTRADLLAEALRDPAEAIRLWALEQLELAPPRSVLLPEVIATARSADEAVRKNALPVLARWQDERVFAELVSALSDVDEEVVAEARAVLERGVAVPPLVAAAAAGTGERPWELVRALVDEVNRWVVRTGVELLGCPVEVHQYRQGVGRTGLVKGQPRRVRVEVTDLPVTSGYLFGEQVMRGIALHELGHHLCDYRARGFRAANGRARSEGVIQVFDILLDERLERVLRSRRPEWGVYFDRLASWVFAQEPRRVVAAEYAELVGRSPEEVVAAVGRGDLPGRLAASEVGVPSAVLLRPSELLAIPGAVPVAIGFLLCLRCGFDPRIHPDPAVAEAVAAVPGNLKDLHHAELLVVARAVARIIGLDDRSTELLELRKRMRRLQSLLGGLERALERLAQAVGLPGWSSDEAAGIRRTEQPKEAAPPSGRRVVVTRAPGRLAAATPRGGDPLVNLAPDERFDELEATVRLAYDAERHAGLVAGIRPHIRVLRSFLERLGRGVDVEPASRRGRRLDLVEARKLVWRPTANLLVFEREVVAPDLYLGVLVDRSGSMDGRGIERARSFGALVCEAARGVRGIEGHVNAFDHRSFIQLGDLQRNAIASLEAGGGNNDAGGLWRAAQLALASRKRHRVLVMISDGMPTECSFASLKALVERLSGQYGIVCAQVAVDAIEEVAFPSYVDLSAFALDEAVARFGRLLVQLTREWR